MKKLPLLALSILVASTVTPRAARADVVRPAPNFSLATGNSIASFKGQPVVLLIAPSPRSSAFRKQAKRLGAVFQEFAARNAVFVVAFTEADAQGQPIPSNVPFVVANDGAKVAAAYGFNGIFSLNVIGKDGNLDLTTAKIVPASRVMDMILNNYEQQTAERKL